MADHMHGCICLECQVDAEEGRPPCRLCSCRGVEDGPCDCECHGPRVLEDYPEPPDRWKEDEEL